MDKGTSYSAEQWKSRALYEEQCKLSAERTLVDAMAMLQDALFRMAAEQPLGQLVNMDDKWNP